MKTTFVSTLSLADTARSQMMRQTALVDRLQVELSSGRKADVGLDLGSRTGEAVTLRAEFSFLNAISDTNALTASRLDVSQAALGDMLANAQDFLATLIAVRDSDGSAALARSEAIGGLDLLTSRLNTQLNGSYLFAGLNSDVAPVADYSDPAQPNKIAADAAFLGAFGFDQTNAGVSGISAAAMQTYLDGPFAALFADPAWGTTWSSATDETTVSRISTSETLNSSVSANEDPFRELAQVYTMMSDLGNTALNKETQKVVVDKAIALLGSAIAGVVSEMGSLGTAQERVTLASERLSIQTDILNERINALELVNLEETSVRLNTALTQLETTYAISARIQQLSILNYI
ncbi:flagellar hook-associated family protein [Roseibium aestuarii]|uniref:Flagellin n=1 Tax=Roseibium aestuarii TaxID=2600299 RepID=A0ABW4JUL1_9HYPH|nr:flagellar hook-associated family protein [Roseibium aestuarii]